MEDPLTGLEPVADESSRILVLGSMPGDRSIAVGQYYAHPRNAFWRIMNRIVGLNPESPYEDRLCILKGAGIALWDVIRSCKRRGSLDVSIDPDSITGNNFRLFLDRHPGIKLICFNGAAAQRCYGSYILPTLDKTPITHARLPSTSPAHASMSFEQKVAEWSSLMAPHLAPRLSAGRKSQLRRRGER